MQFEQPKHAGAPTVLLVGYGEVGRAFATRISGTAGGLIVVDPVAGAGASGVAILREPPDTLEGVDIVLAAVPASASVSCAAACAASPGDFLYVDCSSSSRTTMEEAAAAFSPREFRFVDAAIMGSIDLHGADTPMIIAGEKSAEAAGLLARIGLQAEVLEGGQSGDASALKLLRTVVTKGLEAVAVEGFLAARAMGLEDRLRENLADVGLPSFPDFLGAIIRTHVPHARRRAREIGDAVAQIEQHGCDATVSRSVLDLFERTADRLAQERRVPAIDGVDDALAWLGAHI